jgi:hypothetical protein
MVRLAFRSSFLFEHDLFGKPDSTFPDHALGGDRVRNVPGLYAPDDGACSAGGDYRTKRYRAEKIANGGPI